MKELPKKDSHEVAGGVRAPDIPVIPVPNPGPIGLPPLPGCPPVFDPLKPVEK